MLRLNEIPQQSLPRGNLCQSVPLENVNDQNYTESINVYSNKILSMSQQHYSSCSPRRNSGNGDRDPMILLLMVDIIPIDLVVDVVAPMVP